MGKNKYTEIWVDTLPDILKVITDGQHNGAVQMDEDWFESVGNRKSYRFRLELINGLVENNIDGTAVARDLYGILSANWRNRQTLWSVYSSR